jgi:hypothetical protein
MIHFLGTTKGAQGGVMHLTIACNGNPIFNKSYSQTFDASIDLSPGSYTVSMSAATPGDFAFNVQGALKRIDPPVPDHFNNTMHVYEIEV